MHKRQHFGFDLGVVNRAVFAHCHIARNTVPTPPNTSNCNRLALPHPSSFLLPISIFLRFFFLFFRFSFSFLLLFRFFFFLIFSV
ncbi:hypothetical protein GPALN_003781 [Globodera pallida]|nr:hypothetical protein GPALN_003781 [Globodera pallida]